MKQQHLTQTGILKKLLFAESLRYTELKPSQDIENNTFDFHLDQLINQGFITKKDSSYSLTNSGKEFAGLIDTDKTVFTKQAKVSVLLFATKQINNKKHYLLYTRLKQPFYGTQGLISGKVGWGEKITETAERELFEESGLKGKAEIAIMRHYLVKNKDTKELLEDKLMFFCVFREPTGEIVESAEGKYEWVEENNLENYVTNPVDELWKENLSRLDKFNGTQAIEEYEQFTDKF
jgi:ADP-ribose pyrophosphatase YjhB (NUDIX family)/predicted transcriptional regulator